MTINVLGYWGMGILILISVIIGIIIYKIKVNENIYVITSEEHKRALEDSKSIQPNNSSIFEGQTTEEIIESGFDIMEKEHYRMLKGVDLNGL